MDTDTLACRHYAAGTCRSCTLLEIPHVQQVRTADQQLRELLAPFVADPDVWEQPVVSPIARFRNRAKMIVTGTANAPVLGLPGQGGEDLADCPLYPEAMEPLLDGVRALIRRAQVPPYDVERRRGEIKSVLVTIVPDRAGDERAMVRLVLRSEKALGRLREHLPHLLAEHPEMAVVTANIHPEHVALLEGDTEIHLAGQEHLEAAMGPVTLRAVPRSFLQTNTVVAGELYAQVGAWVREIIGQQPQPVRVWDLYCGVGGFALACAQAGAEVTGIEIAPAAIDAARQSAREAGLSARFLAEDATAWVIGRSLESDLPAPDVVIVNPPRRGIGPELAGWLQESGPQDVIYSSCNPATLATDLQVMSDYEIVRARLVDMFPHTRHDEVVVRLRRRGTASTRRPSGQLAASHPAAEEAAA